MAGLMNIAQNSCCTLQPAVSFQAAELSLGATLTLLSLLNVNTGTCIAPFRSKGFKNHIYSTVWDATSMQADTSAVGMVAAQHAERCGLRDHSQPTPS